MLIRRSQPARLSASRAVWLSLLGAGAVWLVLLVRMSWQPILADEVQVSTSGCLGTCDHGPVMIAYPEGAWYSELKPGDVDWKQLFEVEGVRWLHCGGIFAALSATTSELKVVVPAEAKFTVPVLVETRGGRTSPLSVTVTARGEATSVEPDVAMPGQTVAF